MKKYDVMFSIHLHGSIQVDSLEEVTAIDSDYLPPLAEKLADELGGTMGDTELEVVGVAKIDPETGYLTPMEFFDLNLN